MGQDGDRLKRRGADRPVSVVAKRHRDEGREGRDIHGQDPELRLKPTLPLFDQGRRQERSRDDRRAQLFGSAAAPKDDRAGQQESRQIDELRHGHGEHPASPERGWIKGLSQSE